MTQILKLMGFTLLEIMLVVLIMAVLATSGIGIYRSYSVTAKLHQAAIQIQQLQQAALAYYIDNGCWPDTTGTLCPNISKVTPEFCSSANPPSFNGYIPYINALNKTVTNPWGNAYNCQPNGVKFQVFSGEIPNPTPGVANLLVTRLLGLLPSGVALQPDANQILTEVVKPASSILTSLMVKGIITTGSLSDGLAANTPRFHCPPQWTPHAIAIPFSFNTSFNNEDNHGCYVGNVTIGHMRAGEDDQDTPVCSPEADGYICDMHLTFESTITRSGLGLCNVLLSARTVPTGKANFTIIYWCQAPTYH